jgi:hypothetical protein
VAVVTRFPTTNAAKGTDTQWTNPSNAHADDGVNAVGADPGPTGLVFGNKWGTFGFGAVIPVGATITKVQVIIEDGITGIGVNGHLNTQPIVGGTDQTLRGDFSGLETYPVVHTVDHTADRAWTRADLLDGTFEVNVRFVADVINGNTCNLDYVKVEVTYTPGSTPANKDTGARFNLGLNARDRVARKSGAWTRLT